MLTGESSLIRAARKIRDEGPSTVVIKKGEHGVLLFHEDQFFMLPAYPLEEVFDPTGAGDAYRAGIIKGILNNWNWQKAGQVASLAAVYAVEHYGTQEHHYSSKDFIKRYEDNFGRFETG